MAAMYVQGEQSKGRNQNEGYSQGESYNVVSRSNDNQGYQGYQGGNRSRTKIGIIIHSFIT